MHPRQLIWSWARIDSTATVYLMTKIDHDAVAAEFGRRLGAHLKALRNARGLTQPVVAERLGGETAVETISRFERGTNLASPVWVSRFAEVYGTTLEAIYLGALGQRLVDDPRKQALHDLIDQSDGNDVRVALEFVGVIRRAAEDV